MSFVSALYQVAMPALAYCAAPFFYLHPRGRLRLNERYGHWNLPPGSYLWLHGASLGEVQGLIPLCTYIRERFPAKRLLLTATSPTGLEAGRSYVHEVRLLPFDAPALIRRALTGVSVEGFIFGETELWPTLLSSLEKRQVPRCLVNARISDATSGIYLFFGNLFRPHMQALSCICAGDEGSMQRLLNLGAAKDVV
ncbi:MAG: hypothetical protein EBZ48_03030, partial [Proteobacteria bacterium]|nr:hypothetical protein [Pseudomonadota bacterium]